MELFLRTIIKHLLMISPVTVTYFSRFYFFAKEYLAAGHLRALLTDHIRLVSPMAILKSKIPTASDSAII